LQDFARGKSNQSSVFIDSSGKVFSIPSHSLPSARGMGEPISGRVNAESGVSFISTLIGDPEDKFIFTNSAGYGYISEFLNTVSNKKTGKAFMKMPEGAQLLKTQKLRSDHQYIAAVSNIGKLLIFKIDELPILPKGKGNKIINIPTAKFKSKEEWVIDIQLLAGDSNLIVHYGSKSRSLPFKDWQHYISTRAKRGNLLAGHLKRVESISEETKQKPEPE